jgi:hypothetical protein
MREIRNTPRHQSDRDLLPSWGLPPVVKPAKYLKVKTVVVMGFIEVIAIPR